MWRNSFKLTNIAKIYLCYQAMKDYNYCCSKDGHGLSFPSFSVVFIQTFSIHDNLEFVLPPSGVRNDYSKVREEIEVEFAKSGVYR